MFCKLEVWPILASVDELEPEVDGREFVGHADPCIRTDAALFWKVRCKSKVFTGDLLAMAVDDDCPCLLTCDHIKSDAVGERQRKIYQMTWHFLRLN